MANPTGFVRERVWTEARDRKLVALHRGGLAYAAIAAEVGVSTNAAAGRISALIRQGTLRARSGKWAYTGERPDWLIVALARPKGGHKSTG
jgi:transposase